MEPPQVNPSDGWLTERFRAYYAEHPPEIPDRFGRREYGFLHFGRKSMYRHIGFDRREDFEAYHASRGPSHAYYSTAYYQRPNAPTMAEKGWMGAELIFDLDADHVPGAEKLPYVKQLEKVKDHFLRLVNEFLRGDFGFSEDELLLTFSGGRGYHCHVLNERALELSSQERREIVDYITGTGIEPSKFIRDKVVGTRGRNSQYERAVASYRISPQGSPGWGGRLNDSLTRYLENLKAGPDEAILEVVEALPGVGPKRSELALVELRRLDIERIRQGFLDQAEILRKLVPHVLHASVIPFAKGETDEPVTSDTKRLIRLPGSLHGKTGFKVVTLRVDELESFDPLTQAIAFGVEPTKIVVTKALGVPIGGAAVQLEPGPATVTEAQAVFAIARGAAAPADLGSGSGA